MEAKKDTSTMDYGEIFKGNTRAFEQLFKNYYARCVVTAKES